MNETAKKQVDQSYYKRPTYASIERFVSYQGQIEAIRETGAKKVLFVGIGDGTVPFYLRSVLGLEVTTVDIDPELHPDVVADIKKLPFEDETFDAVAAFEVLEHMPFDSFEPTLRELNRVTKRAALISLPYRHSGIDFVFKFPFVRSIFKKNWLRLRLSFPIHFPGFAISGQHYWEIDNAYTPKRMVRSVIEKVFNIEDSHYSVLDAYRYFLTLEKKNNSKLSNTFVEEYYDKHLQDLDEDYETSRWHSSPVAEFDYKQTKKSILHVLRGRQSGKTLEIGPGDGVWTRLIIPISNKLVLVDQSKEMLLRAEKRLNDIPHIIYHHGDLQDFKTDETFDLIFGSRCFEYFENKNAALQRMKSMLSQDGEVVIITKNANYISRSKKALHTAQMSKREMLSLFRENGFTVEEVFSATLRIKAAYVLMRILFSFLHNIHVLTAGRFNIPKLFDMVTESYMYVAKKK